MTSVVLATSNGTGMGHLTRQAAVALALDNHHQSTLFSLSIGLPLATGLGIRGEYCPSYDRPWIATRDWHAYLRDRLIALVEEIEAEAVAFDGVAPYPGIGLASAALREVAFVWIRRGMWQPEANKQALSRGRFFDLVIEPGDIAAAADAGPTAGLADVKKVAPISILQVVEPLPRFVAREQLGLPQDRPVALITLGSGRLGDVAGPGTHAVERLLDGSPDWHIAVTRSPVALNEVPLDQASRISEIHGVYPLARYLAAFDVAVSSAGYNAVHELVPAGIPTLLVANTSTRTDDQVTRAGQMEKTGLALFAADNDPVAMAEKIQKLLIGDVRDQLATRAAQTLSLMTGATETGEATVDFAEGFERRRVSMGDTVRNQLQSVKEGVKGLLGEDGTARVKRLLGRSPSPVHQRSEVRIVDHVPRYPPTEPIDLAFVGSVNDRELRQEIPIEHVMPGTSKEYRERRLEIIRDFYDVES